MSEVVDAETGVESPVTTAAEAEVGGRHGAPVLPGSRRRLRLPRRLPSLYEFLAGLLGLGVLLLILYPVGRMVLRAFFPGGAADFSAVGVVANAPYLGDILRNTVMVVGVAGLCSLVIAGTFAWLNERTNANFGILGDILPLVPLLVPSVALAIGWTFLGAPQVGFVNGFLSATLGAVGIDAQVNIYSRPGLIFVYTLEFVPYVYLLVAAALRNLDPSMEEASLMSGASLGRTIRKVSLPAVMPALVGSALLLAIVGFGLYSIPVIIGTPGNIDILSVRVIRMLKFEFPPRTDEALVLSIVLMVVIGAVWMIQRRIVGAGNFATIGGRAGGSSTRIDLGRWRWVARGGMGLYLLCASILPLAALFLVSLQPFWSPSIDPSLFSWQHYREILFVRATPPKALRFSLTIAVIGGALTMVVAAMLAILSKRRGGTFGRLLGGVTKLPAAIPNMVVAIGFLVAFSGPPLRLSGTLLLLMLCYMVLYMPQASIAAESSLAQVGGQLAEASAMSGASDGRTFRRIQFPLMIPGVASGWALIFVLMVGDLTASALLAGIRNPVVGFVILDIWEQGTFGSLAALASIVSVLTTTFVGLMTWISRPKYKRVKS